MGRNTSILVTISVVLAAADLAQKAAAPIYGHGRSLGYVLLAALLFAGVVALVPRVPSRTLAVAGGVAAAGALGNLVSALAWSGGVPNPIVAGGIAFNLADVYAVAGSAALVVCAAAFAVRHPERLREPVSPR